MNLPFESVIQTHNIILHSQLLSKNCHLKL